MEKKYKCINCEEEITESNACFSDNKEPVCEHCFSNTDPIATILYSDNRGEYDSEDSEEFNSKDVITSYRNPTLFEIEWKSSDAWRGYNEVVKHPGWSLLHTDTILAMSEDAEDLKDFDLAITQYLEENNLAWAKVFCTTSNLFSQGYDLFIETEDKNVIETLKIRAKVCQLVREHRDSEKFKRTALTGSSEDTKEAKLLTKAFEKIKNGSSFEDIKKDLENGK